MESPAVLNRLRVSADIVYVDRCPSCRANDENCPSLELRPRLNGGVRISACGSLAWCGFGPRLLGETPTRLRASEARKRQGGEPWLMSDRWWWLRHPEKVNGMRPLRLSDPLELNLWTVRIDQLKEDFQPFRNGRSPRQADRSLLRQRGLTMLPAPARGEAHAVSKQRPFRSNACRSLRPRMRGRLRRCSGEAKSALGRAYGASPVGSVAIARSL